MWPGRSPASGARGTRPDPADPARLEAALPGTVLVEYRVERPFDEVWGWLADLERSAPTFDSNVHRLEIVRRDGSSLRIRWWTSIGYADVGWSGECRATTSRLLVLAARSLVKAAIPQCRGGYVEMKAVRTMAWLLLGVVRVRSGGPSRDVANGPRRGGARQVPTEGVRGPASVAAARRSTRRWLMP